MSNAKPKTDSLVLYKRAPAKVLAVADKIDIELESGKTKRVRDKDIVLLHPGPVDRLANIDELGGNLEEAWELAAGETLTLEELSEILFDDFTPSAAWSVWKILDDGLYFDGDPTAITAHSEQAVAAERADREKKAKQAEEWDAFIERVREGKILDEDRKRLAEVERVALDKSVASRILDTFEVKANPESAHRFLVKCGYWPATFNPWPGRHGAEVNSPVLAVPGLEDEPRRDLTHLSAYAIDDVGNEDPDDAISIEGDRLWVHVADVAALVKPDSEIDLAARARGANLYLPEAITTMLPAPVTPILGMGLQEVSPALSFGFGLGEEGVTDVEITPSWVKVTRTTYADVDTRLDEPDFGAMLELTERFQAQRQARDAANIDLPEVILKVENGEVLIRPMEKLRARQMVTDAMLMAGEAAARFAQSNNVAIPYAVQPVPDEIQNPQTMSEAFAYRRFFKPSQTTLSPGRHFGLGLEMYSRTTSPLRRYQDLLTHQQLRAHVMGYPVLSAEALSERVQVSNERSLVIRRSERQANQHWKLVYLRDNPGWEGEAVVVELAERKMTLMIPELAMETRVRLDSSCELDQVVNLKLREVDLPSQHAVFSVLQPS